MPEEVILDLQKKNLQKDYKKLIGSQYIISLGHLMKVH